MKKVILPALCLGALCVDLGAQTAAFDYRDEIEGAHVTLAAFPIRPMVYRRNASRLWAINHHDNSLIEFVSSGTSTPVSAANIHPLPWAPVSVAFWEGPNGTSDETSGNDDQILVVCRGTWALVSVRVADGRITDVVQGAPIGVMAEPADIVVDSANDRAFVSCPAADSVIQIDLTTTPKSIVRVFRYDAVLGASDDDDFRCKSPTFLSLDSDGTVLVTPLTSGNSSRWGGGSVSGNTVLDLETASGLDIPDQDLFRISPKTSSSDGGVVPVTTDVGTTLFGHARHPSTGDLWVLNSEARNKFAGPQSEPDFEGELVFQRVTAIDTGSPGGKEHYSLDPDDLVEGDADADVAATLDTGEAPGQPFALAFNGVSGHALIVGALSDNLVILESDGDALSTDWDLPTISGKRAIPRGILIRSSSTTTVGAGVAFVYAWGHNKVYQVDYDASSSTPTFSLARTYDLGFDPTPAEIARGRAIFFDGSNSRHENASCATCHIDGGSDQLVWNLSHRALLEFDGNFPVDDKGGMVTQTMVGLARLAPFHWRGERMLEDFNGAFEGLLGGEDLDPLTPPDTDSIDEDDFADLQAFVFSLVNPANPLAAFDRDIHADLQYFDEDDTGWEEANAVDGQTTFQELVLFRGQFRCADCHAQPTGTIHDINPEVAELERPHRAHFKPAAFHELWRKEQPTIVTSSPADELALVGAGLFHTGNFNDLHDVVSSITNEAASIYDEADITAFIRQWDSGLGQAAHAAVLVDPTTHVYTPPSTPPSASTELQALIARADDGDCDLVVLGLISGYTVRNRWLYHPALTTEFVSEDPGIADRTLQDFLDALVPPSAESCVFVGVPRGRGRGLSIDLDNDGWLNDDSTNETDPRDPTDPGTAISSTLEIVSGSLDVLWVTATTARVRFETNQPTTATVFCRPIVSGGTTVEFEAESPNLSLVHSVIFNQLEPSTNAGSDTTVPDVANDYELKIVIADVASNPVTYAYGSSMTDAHDFTTLDHITPTGPGEWSPTTGAIDRMRLHEHILSGGAITALEYSNDVVAGTVEFQIDFKRGATHDADSLEREPAPNRVVIGRMMVRRAISADGPRHGVPVEAVVVAGSSQWSVDHVRLESMSGRRLQSGGDDDENVVEFLFTTVPSDGTGYASLDFKFGDTTLATDDEVWFVVDAVVEVDDSEWSPSSPPIDTNMSTSETTLVLPTDDLGGIDGTGQMGFSQWSFPVTKEFRALIKEKL